MAEGAHSQSLGHEAGHIDAERDDHAAEDEKRSIDLCREPVDLRVQSIFYSVDLRIERIDLRIEPLPKRLRLHGTSFQVPPLICTITRAR